MTKQDMYQIEHELIDNVLRPEYHVEYTPEQLFLYIVGIHNTINTMLEELKDPMKSGLLPGEERDLR